MSKNEEGTNVPAKGKGKKKMPIDVANWLSELKIASYESSIENPKTSARSRGGYNFLLRREKDIVEARNGKKERDDIMQYFNAK